MKILKLVGIFGINLKFLFNKNVLNIFHKSLVGNLWADLDPFEIRSSAPKIPTTFEKVSTLIFLYTYKFPNIM